MYPDKRPNVNIHGKKLRSSKLDHDKMTTSDAFIRIKNMWMIGILIVALIVRTKARMLDFRCQMNI